MSKNPLIDDSNQALVKLMSEGLTVAQAAKHLHLNPQTAYSRLNKLRPGLGAQTNTHLVAIALRKHLIT